MSFFRLRNNDQTVPVQLAVRKCNSLLSWSGSSASMQTKHIKEALQSLLLDFHPNTNQQRVTGFWGESTSLLGETWEKSQYSPLCCIPAACTPVTCSACCLQVHTDLFPCNVLQVKQIQSWLQTDWAWTSEARLSHTGIFLPVST